jgi:hypothetical protein
MQSSATSKRKNQKQIVLDYLKRHRNGLSPIIALHVLGVYRLAARIEELRKQGHRIASIYRKDDLGRRFVEYRLRRD